jgi:hypothetical protein
MTHDHRANKVATVAQAYANAASQGRPTERLQAELLEAVTTLLGKPVIIGPTGNFQTEVK